MTTATKPQGNNNAFRTRHSPSSADNLQICFFDQESQCEERGTGERGRGDGTGKGTGTGGGTGGRGAKSGDRGLTQVIMTQHSAGGGPPGRPPCARNQTWTTNIDTHFHITATRGHSANAADAYTTITTDRLPPFLPPTPPKRESCLRRPPALLLPSSRAMTQPDPKAYSTSSTGGKR